MQQEKSTKSIERAVATDATESQFVGTVNNIWSVHWRRRSSGAGWSRGCNAITNVFKRQAPRDTSPFSGGIVEQVFEEMIDNQR